MPYLDRCSVIKQKIKAKIHIENYWALFFGEFPENQKHRHFPVEISISLKGSLEVLCKNDIISDKQLLINSNTSHQYINPSPILSILISPLCPLGFSLLQHLNKKPIMPFNSRMTKQLKHLGESHWKKEMDDHVFIDNIRGLLKKENSKVTNVGIDERIWSVLRFMKENSESVIKAKEAAKMSHLSESRFLHLFKEETGINFRSIQIWNKLVNSLTLFRQKKTISEIAHQCGFSDSAHFNRKFKAFFGFPPKYIKNNSYFVQF